MQELFYSRIGEGRPVVFLHGFLEDHTIWSDYAQQLSKKYQIVTYDLPGFGKSPLPSEKAFTISDIATQINQSLLKAGLHDITIIGHSLGGYVALAMVEQQPHLFHSLCLFHSTALADSPEKKESRTKTIDFVAKNGALAFTSNFVAPLFADPHHPAVPKVTALAIQTSVATISAYLAAMRDRPDRTSVVKHFIGAVLFIAGERDSIIPAPSLAQQAGTSDTTTIRIIEGIGHMGMFEAPALCLEIIEDFLSFKP